MKLDLLRLLTPANVFLALEAETKEGVIEEMIRGLTDAGLIDDYDAALAAVLDRERRMSTGLEKGVAVPHGKTDSVATLVCALAVKREGVDFASIDGEPVRIIVMTISPAARMGPHIQFLAEITGLLKSVVRRERIVNASTVDEILSVLRDES
jgi:PTS system nitrogen regulatory IIA component